MIIRITNKHQRPSTVDSLTDPHLSPAVLQRQQFTVHFRGELKMQQR